MHTQEREKIQSSLKRDFRGQDISHLETKSHMPSKDPALVLRTSMGFYNPGKTLQQESNTISKFGYPSSPSNSLQSKHLAQLPLIGNGALTYKESKKTPIKQFINISTDIQAEPLHKLLEGIERSATSIKTSEFKPESSPAIDHKTKDSYFDLVKKYDHLRFKDSSLLLSMYKMIPNCLQDLPSNRKQTEVLRQWFAQTSADASRSDKLEISKLAMLEAIRQVYVGFGERGSLMLELLNYFFKVSDQNMRHHMQEMKAQKTSFDRCVDQMRTVFQRELDLKIEKCTDAELACKDLERKLAEVQSRVSHLEAVESK